MYVRKFEADTLDEALKDIKRELGPDAIILKTITNSGLKGAFKKKKIEITAAISEKNYVRKAKVDSVLNEDQKGEFYNSSSSYISNMIDKMDEGSQRKNLNTPAAKTGYGDMGLNRQVSSTKNIVEKVKSNLDDFLSLGEQDERNSSRKMSAFSDEELYERPMTKSSPATSPSVASYQENTVQRNPSAISHETEKELEVRSAKIEELEKRLFELTRQVEKIQRPEPIGVYQLRNTLRSLNINESYIQRIVKKALFELSTDEAQNAEVVFEFALREMMGQIRCEMPLFSSVDNKNPVITVLISDSTSGQSSMALKIGALKSDSVIIKYVPTIQLEQKASFAEKMFKLNVVKAKTLAEIVGEARKAAEAGKAVFIDYKCVEAEINETKKFIDGLRRSFAKVEVLITLSAIHSELYNRKVISTYRRLSDGLVVSQLDECLNFGALFNIADDVNDLPFKFFGTGTVIPEDLETATAERIMAGIFKLS